MEENKNEDENLKKEEKENTAENNIETMNKGIPFYKKIWYSVGKVSKYDAMSQEGVGKAFKYLFALVSILALILGIISAFIQMDAFKNTKKYISDILPELKVVDNELILENEETTIIDDEETLKLLGSSIIINPYMSKEEAIREYAKPSEEKSNCIIFLKNEVLAIPAEYIIEEKADDLETKPEEKDDDENQEESDEKENDEKENGEEEFDEEKNKFEKFISYTYNDIISANNEEVITSKEYGKIDIVNYLCGPDSFIYFLGVNFGAYIVILLIKVMIYVLLIGISMFIVSKVLKLDITFQDMLAKTIYASTLAQILYVLYGIINIFGKFVMPYVDIIEILAIYIYILLILIKKRKEWITKNKK